VKSNEVPKPPSYTDSATIKSTQTVQQSVPPQQPEFMKEPGTLQKLGETVMKKALSSDESKFIEESLSVGRWDMEVFKAHLKATSKMGNLTGAAKFIHGMSQFKDQIKQYEKIAVEQSKETEMFIKMIDILTPEEKKAPEILQKHAFKAKKRIADQSGTTVEDVNRLLDKYFQTKKVQMVLLDLKKTGKPMPSSMEDLTTIMKQAGLRVP